MTITLNPTYYHSLCEAFFCSNPLSLFPKTFKTPHSKESRLSRPTLEVVDPNKPRFKFTSCGSAASVRLQLVDTAGDPVAHMHWLCPNVGHYVLGGVCRSSACIITRFWFLLEGSLVMHSGGVESRRYWFDFIPLLHLRRILSSVWTSGTVSYECRVLECTRCNKRRGNKSVGEGCCGIVPD